MRTSSRLPILIGFLAADLLGGQQPKLAPHPGHLRFSEARVQLPTVEGRRFALPDGPVVYLVEDSTLPLVEISLALRIGSFVEPPEQTGLAYLTASQLRRGGTAALDADRFDRSLDDLGTRIDTMSGTTRAGATLSVPSWSLDRGLDLFFEMLSTPAFQADRHAVARGNLRESLSRRNQNALEVLQREWEWLMYGHDHFSTRPMTSRSLAAFRRNDLLDFHRQYWQPHQMIVAISGDFDAARLLPDLERRFRRWGSSQPGGPPLPWPPPPPTGGAQAGLYHYEMDVPQAKVIVGHRLPDLLDWRDPDRFALAVVGELLGGQGAISRIAGRLRTAEGLVYRTSTDLYPGDLWPGELRIFLETQGQNVGHSVALVAEEIERLRTEPAHPTELAVVKQTLASRLRLRFDTAEEIAGYFAEDELLDRPHSYWQLYLEGVDQVSANAVREAAATYLRPSSLSYLVVGRWQEISQNREAGRSPLEEQTGHRKISLPRRDPSTLEVLAAEEP